MMEKAPTRSMSVSFIVPTFKRPEYLARCLDAISRQSLAPTEILVGIKGDDFSNREVLAAFESPIPIRTIRAEGRGVVGSMNSCLVHAKSELIALIDDDVEIPPVWLKTMAAHLAKSRSIVGAAGRDFLLDDPEMRRRERRTKDVGTFHWYGRISGNHHCGSGLPRRVDILRGSNCLFRGDFLHAVGFETMLRGDGAQVNWELGLALQARMMGKEFVYDPTIEVQHYVAPRHDADQLHRGGFNSQALEDMIYNEVLMVELYGPKCFRFLSMGWSLLVGGGLTVGLLKAIQLVWQRDVFFRERLTSCLRGRVAALQAAKRLRQRASSRHLNLQKASL